MTSEELKQIFPIGKLYQISFADKSKKFEAYLHGKIYIRLKCKSTIFLLVDIVPYSAPLNYDSEYIELVVLFSTGELGEIFFIKPSELKLIQ